MIKSAYPIFICLLNIYFDPAYSQVDLYHKIVQQDSMFFAALNNCDLDMYNSFLTADFEAFHDKQGFTPSRENEMASMLIYCGEQRKSQPLKRELIPGTLEVYTIPGYGAIQTGEHRFYLIIDKQISKLVAKSKFTTIWKQDDKAWKISRTLSYDHQPLGQVQLPDSILISYEGNYAAPDRTINIKKLGSILKVTDLIEGKEVWSGEILPQSNSVFYLNFENVVFQFIKKESKIEKLVITNKGIIEECRKLN